MPSLNQAFGSMILWIACRFFQKTDRLLLKMEESGRFLRRGNARKEKAEGQNQPSASVLIVM
jgi:hypothetical protein